MRLAVAAAVSMLVFVVIATGGHAATVTPAQVASASQKLGAMNPLFFGSSFDVAMFRGRALSEGGVSAGGASTLSQMLSSQVVFGEKQAYATSFFEHARFANVGHY